MKPVKYKIIGSRAGLLAAAIVAYFFSYQYYPGPPAVADRSEGDPHELHHNKQPPAKEATLKAVANPKEVIPVPQVYRNEAPRENISTAGPISSDDELAAETAIMQYRDHREKLGYFAPAQYENYSSYSDETLLEMGLNGDILAVQLAARRAIESGDFEKGLRAHYFSATLGSAYSSLELATTYEAEFAGMDVDEDKFRPFITESIAWKLVAVAQGDAEALIDIKASVDANGMEFTESDRTAILNRFGELQAAMDSERDNRGFASDVAELSPAENNISYLIKEQFREDFDDLLYRSTANH